MMTGPEFTMNAVDECYSFISCLPAVYGNIGKGSDYIPKEERVFR
jgi:hypothetical protein